MQSNVDLENKIRKLDIHPYIGTFSGDCLPKIRRVGCYIINMEDADKGVGTHWVAFIIRPNGRCWYFDSFGLPPRESVKEFLKPCKTVYNMKQIQNINSSICGYYCIGFLLYMTKIKCDFITFVDLFSDDVTKNDDILNLLLRQFKMSLYH